MKRCNIIRYKLLITIARLIAKFKVVKNRSGNERLHIQNVKCDFISCKWIEIAQSTAEILCPNALLFG